MDEIHQQGCIELSTTKLKKNSSTQTISMEAEIPEALYEGVKEFLLRHPSWDQYHVMSSALANFLFQNGCNDRYVTERYLNDLFKRSDA